MIKELDQIVLKENLSEYGLQAGDIGTVVLVHQNGNCEAQNHDTGNEKNRIGHDIGKRART